MKWVRAHLIEIAVTAFVVLLGAAVYAYAHKDVDVLEQSKTRGAIVVDALERYRAARGSYPDSLAMLVPEFVSAIEPPTWGLQRWTYQRYTSADVSNRVADGSASVYFQLSVAQNPNGYPVLYYDIIARRWVLNN